MTNLFLFVGVVGAINYLILIKSCLMDLDVKNNKKVKCSKCNLEYSDKNEKATINNSGICITCRAINKR